MPADKANKLAQITVPLRGFGRLLFDLLLARDLQLIKSLRQQGEFESLKVQYGEQLQVAALKANAAEKSKTASHLTFTLTPFPPIITLTGNSHA